MGLTRQQIITIAVLLSGTLIAVLNMTLLSPALPAIMSAMSVDATTVQWLTSGYALVEAIIIPMSAFIMGRLTTRKLYLLGMTIFAAGSLMAAFAPSFPFLLLGRVMQATCTGMVMPMVMSLIMLIFPRERRGTGMGLVSLIIGFAPAIGPSLSGLLVDTVGWRALFSIVAILAVLVILAATFFLKNQSSFERTSFDLPSVLLSTFGLLSMLYGLSSIASSGTPEISLALIAVGAILVGLFARRQTKLEHPMLRVRILKTRNYRIAVIVMFCVQAALVGSDVIMPLYLQNVLGNSALTTGLVMLPGAVTGAIMSMLAGRLFDHFGVRPIALAGGSIMAAGAISVAFLGISSPIWIIALTFTVMSFGLQLTMTPVNTWGINSIDNSQIQHGNALTNTLNQVGGSLGTAILVSVDALAMSLASAAPSATERLYAGTHASFTVTAALLLVMFAIVIIFVHNKKTRAEAPAVETPTANTQEAARIRSTETADAQTGVYTIVHEAMNDTPYFVPNTATIRDVTLQLAHSETSGVPVVSAADQSVVGFISDDDIMGYLGDQSSKVADINMNVYYLVDDKNYQERFRTLLAMNVMQLATKRVISVSEDMPLDAAVRVLADRKIKKVPVVDAQGHLAGTLSRRDVIRKLARLLPESKNVAANTPA